MGVAVVAAVAGNHPRFRVTYLKYRNVQHPNHIKINPFRSAVPFLGTNYQKLEWFVLAKRDCGSKRVK